MRLPFFWVDAFSKVKMGGNPCAVVLNADDLTAAQMQALAREINLSETAFVSSSQKADFAARFFTPQGELPFAGHPTLSVAHVVFKTVFLGLKQTKINLELPAGVIPLEIEMDEKESSKVSMRQMAPRFMASYETQKIMPLYGLCDDDLLSGARVQTVSTGSPILMIPLKNKKALQKVHYADIDSYIKLKSNGDFLFAHHFILEGATARGRTFARSLGNPPLLLEDPFTGSATGCMAAFLWKYKLISETRFLAEQGHWLARPGEAEVELVGTFEDIQNIKVSGHVVTLMQGHLDI